MADNNNNRKSKRNFSLEKPVERRFDIEKEVDAAPIAPAKPAPAMPTTPNQPTGKPAQGRFDTSKEPVTKPGGNVPPTGPNDGGDENNDGGNSSKKWIIIALIIGAIAACAYFFMSGSKSDEGTEPQNLQVEQNDSIQTGNNATDTIANSDNDNEEGVADEGIEAAGESEDNSQDESNNSNEPVSQPSTSANSSQPTGNSSVSQGTTSTPSPSSASNSSIEQKAKDVWKGVYGNNPDRRKNLGSDYETVQKLVNEMHRKGLH